MKLHPQISKILISSEQIQARCRELGAEITRAYRGKRLHLICILKGGFMFLADLVRHIDLEVSVDFMAVSSYGAATTSSGTVRINQDLSRELTGLECLIVEDIVDTGLTLNFLLQHLDSHRPASLKICTLLNKPAARKAEVPIAYQGFEIPPEFVVGYGLDLDEKLRNLPYIGVFDPSAAG